MKISDSVSLQQGTNVTGQRPPRSKMQTFSVQPVGAYVLPASDCGATCVVIAECIANVIIGPRWTTKTTVVVVTTDSAVIAVTADNAVTAMFTLVSQRCAHHCGSGVN